MDENLILNQCIIEERDMMYFYYAFSIYSAYFGGCFHEHNYEDFWIPNGIAGVFAENFMTEKCGVLNTRFFKFKKIKWLRDEMAQGNEKLPLASQLWPNPAEIKRNEIYFVKSWFIMGNILLMIDTEHFIKFI
jgi:hypothetical protein